MPKLDKQGRLTIPTELRRDLNWILPKEIALCYNFQNNTITICDKIDIVDKCVVAFRKLDNKGRFFLPNEVLSLLGLDKDALFIIFLQNDEFCIKGMGGTGT